MRAYLFRAGPVFILSTEKSLEIVGEGRARATMVVALATVPFETIEDLEAASADVGRVELEFVDEGGEWMLTRADWTPATLVDLL